jgi:hypothetical protein
VGENPKLRQRAKRHGRFLFLIASAGLLLGAPAASAGPADGTPPVVTALYYGTAGLSGWYTSNVIVNWKIEDPEGILGWTPGCNPTQLTADTADTRLECSAWSAGGTTTVGTKPIKIDKTAPSVALALERQPDANGWYNRPLTVAFAGTDGTSGVASCSSTRYSGPDNAAAVAGGSCSDHAGNVAPASFSFRYDATAPTLFGVTAIRLNRSAELSWRKSTDTQRVEVWRAPGRGGAGESVVYQGGDTVFRDTGLVVGRRYEYRVAGLDDAANRSEQKIDFIATGALLSPAPAERVTSPPELIWTPVKRASYYNVQLIRGGKVFSAWPTRPGLRLRRTWIHNGRRHRLRPGVYRWYVWPGYGRIKAARYGKLLGSSTFVVTG